MTLLEVSGLSRNLPGSRSAPCAAADHEVLAGRLPCRGGSGPAAAGQWAQAGERCRAPRRGAACAASGKCLCSAWAAA